MSEVKPCPFCGEEAAIDQGHDGWVVACDNSKCSVRPEGFFHTAKDAAIEAWNTRQQPSEAMVEKVARSLIETTHNNMREMNAAFDELEKGEPDNEWRCHARAALTAAMQGREG